MKRKYNYFYKITNHINNHFYYGVHCTDNLNDGYMGSGKRLHCAYKKYGIENFSKEILKFFNTIQEAYEYESEIVTEDLVHNPECYNIQCGGQGWNTYGTVSVQDKQGNHFRCDKNDPKYLSEEYFSNTTGRVTVKDNENNTFSVSINDPRYISGELTGALKGKVPVKDKLGNFLLVDKEDPRYISGELTGVQKNMVVVKDKNGNFFNVSINDPRYISGELTHIWKDRKHSAETKQQMSKTHKLNKHQQGEKNSQYGTCWIYKIDENNEITNLKIKKSELEFYMNNGWFRGRKNLNTTKEKKIRTCMICGKEYYHTPNSGTTKKMCSKQCSEYYKKHRLEILRKDLTLPVKITFECLAS